MRQRKGKNFKGFEGKTATLPTPLLLSPTESTEPAAAAASGAARTASCTRCAASRTCRRARSGPGGPRARPCRRYISVFFVCQVVDGESSAWVSCGIVREGKGRERPRKGWWKGAARAQVEEQVSRGRGCRRQTAARVECRLLFDCAFLKPFACSLPAFFFLRFVSRCTEEMRQSRSPGWEKPLEQRIKRKTRAFFRGGGGSDGG